MKTTSFAIATLLVAGMASMMLADEPKTKPAAKGDKPKVAAEAKSVKPMASPGWVVIEEDWALPFLYDFSTGLHKARVHYRANEEKSASGEIDKAAAWLQLAQTHAEKATAEDLSTARYDLLDISASLKSGKPLSARKLDAAFAHASLALAKHHHFRSGKSLADGDLKTAGRYLMAASDLLRSAAQSANFEYGTEAVEVYDTYAPYGYWDDSIVFEKSKLEANLTTVRSEIDTLAARLKKGK